ncbi:hypothetical protein DQ04_04721030 [Trypanosoma grayi]|uniref:hypothetical protein n=1 Tax=Trypanosoma grayi TaxID=71804 RepID=UPI0004F460E7|nr:hypothetical protein DQ04_04721030 [Trypanosoma grayi]KEG09742.1 hypothetical protein DQ04_04721030 [Trypanosoma grayi]
MGYSRRGIALLPPAFSLAGTPFPPETSAVWPGLAHATKPCYARSALFFPPSALAAAARRFPFPLSANLRLRKRSLFYAFGMCDNAPSVCFGFIAAAFERGVHFSLSIALGVSVWSSLVLGPLWPVHRDVCISCG